MIRWIGKITIIIFGSILFVSCSSDVTIEHDDPESVLRGYFELLVREDYVALVELYGGDYEMLEGYAGHLVKPDDRAALFRHYLNISGGQIVQLNEIIEKKQVSPGKYEFKVNFTTPDGENFRLGQVYTYTVEMINGQYKVMNVPPYVA